MIKIITPSMFSPDVKCIYDNWNNYFSQNIEDKTFIPFIDFQGEDKNILSFQSSEKYIEWWGQSPGKLNEPYRDDCFYTRELTWLSEWCKPEIVVEIGTDKGVGTFLLDRLNPQAKIYTVDIADHAYIPGGQQVEIGFFSKLNKCDILYFKVKPIVSANFIFIDGDHSEGAVWEDSLWAWKHVNPSKRWAIIWHDARQGAEEFRGLLRSINKFSDYTRKNIYRFEDSSAVWMSGGE